MNKAHEHTNRLSNPTAKFSSYVIDPARFDAVLFDLDGVVTQTARVHAAAWKELFDEYREKRLGRNETAYEPFDVRCDYQQFVDGKPRYDGVASFLASRGIELPRGNPKDSPDQETVCGLGNRKNALFQERLQEGGVEVYDSTVRLIHQLREQGFKVAVISSSKNCSAVLGAAHLLELFHARVDGLEAAKLQLRGKPAPDVFEEAARRLGLEAQQCIVVEDAVSGVQAGRQGGFGFVIGVDRTGSPDRLKENGADLVVPDLAQVAVGRGAACSGSSTADLPSALTHVPEIMSRSRRKLAIFLDYDGTLTPIVPRPEDAVMSEPMRDIVRRLTRYCTVAVVSGRDLQDVRRLVALEEIVFAGSHGFDIAGPGGLRKENEEAQSCLPALDQAEALLREKLTTVPGSQVERKKYSVAIHFRNVAENQVDQVGLVVAAVSEQHPNLRRAGGKKVYELQPKLDWHKGRAVLWLLEALGLNRPEVLPVYIGDDLTDEDAFGALRDRGMGIVVRDSDDPRPTQACYALENPSEVGVFLEGIMAHRNPVKK